MSKNLLSIHAKSFSWAGFFLPKKIYKSCSDLYDFCRTLDDIVDQDLPLNEKLKEFKNFKTDFENRNFKNKDIKKIYFLIQNFNIDHNIIKDLFDGVETDLKEIVTFNTKKELIIYSYRVAGTVGLMMAKILNVKSKNSLKSAIDLGIGMQLTNIARDVIEDQNRNRNYITSNFESIKDTINFADIFYERSFKAISEIPFFSRFAILVARRIYREIGYEILKKKNMKNYETAGKIFVSNFKKINQTFLSIFDLFRLYYAKSDEEIYRNEHLFIKEEINLDERI
jgi:phytoene synthase|tara:strand:- start:14841 stop:15689 length:849 start_codon:yes stop_codon:yes gene_type:complete